ncbi:MAG: hypothetical protein Q8935_21255, partial [Bacillota bacterium]|nr:hypothetical protein [Bacillota bacterium]
MKGKTLKYSVAAAFLTSAIQATPTFASPIDSQVSQTKGQISQTQGQISQTQGQISQTQSQLDDLQTKIMKMDNQISIEIGKSQK